jgi:hypothetical protein
MKRCLATAVAVLATLSVDALADYSQSFELVPVQNDTVLPGDDPLVPDFNDGSYFTFDLMITTVDCDFEGASVEATLTGPTAFFQHPAGGHVPPDPNLVAQYPAVEFDIFFDGGPGSMVGVDLFERPQFIQAIWLDLGADLPNDTYRIARFSFQFDQPGTATLTLEGYSLDPHSYSLLIPFGPLVVSVDYVPEPATLAPLTLGGLLTLRRRT